MKAKCLKSDNIEYLTVGKEYEVVKYDKYDNMISFYNDKNELYNYYIYYNYELWFEIIDENKCDKELTFREVIAQIKEGEVWQSKYQRIEIIDKYIKISSIDFDEYNLEETTFAKGYIAVKQDSLFRLQRKQYTFEEAFKSYEEGKEIESCVNGECYLKERDEHNSYKDFSFSQIRGKWHVNNK